MSNSPNTTVRLARLGDVPAITAIHNQGVEERNATFEPEPRTVEQVIAQLAEKGERYTTVVGVWRDCVLVEKLLGDAAEVALESNASSPTGSFASPGTI